MVYSDTDDPEFPGEYMFDFAVVVFGVCTPFALLCLNLTLLLPAVIILREKTLMRRGERAFQLLACKYSIFILS